MQIGQCYGRNFIPVNGTAQYKDYQEIKIQEVYKTLKPGVIPRSTIVILEVRLSCVCPIITCCRMILLIKRNQVMT